MPRKAMRVPVVEHRRPAGRGAMSLGEPRRVRGGSGGSSNITELFDLGGRFDRNEVTREEIDKIRNMIDSDGLRQTAELLGVSHGALLYCLAGFGHRNTRKVAAKLREFLRS